MHKKLIDKPVERPIIGFCAAQQSGRIFASAS